MFDVRDSAGMLRGRLPVEDLSLLSHHGLVRFAVPGFSYLAADEVPCQVQSKIISLHVSRYWTPPVIVGDYYQPGTVDYCLIWDGPQSELYSIATFEGVLTQERRAPAGRAIALGRLG